MNADRVTATYLIETPHSLEHATAVLAGEQSSGTFVAVPGETIELKEKYGARVERIDELEPAAQPSLPGSTAPKAAGSSPVYRRGRVVVSFPLHNIGPSLASLLSTVAGNLYELQELSGVRLEDLDLPDAFARRYPGPAFGVAGTRRVAGVKGRALVGTIHQARHRSFHRGAASAAAALQGVFHLRFGAAGRSIGHVVDRARQRLNAGRTVPIVVGSPPLRRYTVFGNHFAAAGDTVHRLDRHPTMSRHPVTPMREADLRRHLADQTSGTMGLMSLEDLDGSSTQVDARFAQRMAESPAMLLFDVLDNVRLRETGRLLWEEARRTPQFVVGSSGVGYALAAYWRAAGLIPDVRVRFPTITPMRQLLVLSGSASPATAQQIAWARDHGFEALRVPAAALMQSDGAVDVRQMLYDQPSPRGPAGRASCCTPRWVRTIPRLQKRGRL